MSSSPSGPIRYAIYTRQSVEGLYDFSSCQAQFLLCQEHVRNSGEPNLTWIGSRLDDEGFSGATLERPAMQKLRKVVDLGGIQRVYAVVLDRLSRNMRDTVTLLAEFEAAGVELHLVHQPQLTSGPQNRLLRHVLAAFAEFERDMIAERMAESRDYLKRHGRRVAGKVPYGYDTDPVTRQLVPNPVEARRAGRRSTSRAGPRRSTIDLLRIVSQGPDPVRVLDTREALSGLTTHRPYTAHRP